MIFGTRAQNHLNISVPNTNIERAFVTVNCRILLQAASALNQHSGTDIIAPAQPYRRTPPHMCCKCVGLVYPPHPAASLHAHLMLQDWLCHEGQQSKMHNKPCKMDIGYPISSGIQNTNKICSVNAVVHGFILISYEVLSLMWTNNKGKPFADAPACGIAAFCTRSKQDST